jgi:hypothetical protein
MAFTAYRWAIEDGSADAAVKAVAQLSRMHGFELGKRANERSPIEELTADERDAVRRMVGADGSGWFRFWSGAERIAAMSSVLERRLIRLEQAARSWADEPIECEMSEEANDILRTAFAANGHGAQRNRDSRQPNGVRHHATTLLIWASVEREQRLLAIRWMVADNPAAKALLERALGEWEPVVRRLSPESARSTRRTVKV